MRLTRKIKDQILEHVMLKYRDISDLQERVTKLENDWYDTIMGDHIETVNSLPDGFMYKRDSVTGFDGYYVGPAKIPQLFPRLDWSMKKVKPSPANMYLFAVPSDHGFRKIRSQIVEEYTKRIEKHTLILNELETLMKSCTTDKKLIEVWPAAAEIFEKHIKIEHPAPSLLKATKLEELLRS